jgi:hypothetical protein
MSEYVMEGIHHQEINVEEILKVVKANLDTYEFDDKDESAGDSSSQSNFLTQIGNWRSVSLATTCDANVVGENLCKADEGDIPEESFIEDEEIYEEHVIEKWFQADSLPEDLESACRQLIPIVYKGEEHADPETMIRRMPVRELYRYLKQHYDYKKDIRKEVLEESVQEVGSGNINHPNLQELFRLRVVKAERMTGVRGIGYECIVTGDGGELQKRKSGEEYEDNENESIRRQEHLPDAIATENEETNDAENLTVTLGMFYGDNDIQSILAENHGLPIEENSDSNSMLPDSPYKFFTEMILEGSRKIGFDCSLHDMEGSSRSFTEEVVEGGLSTQSFLEEVVIEETEGCSEENSDHASTLPDRLHEHVVEDILEGSSNRGFDFSLQGLGGSANLFNEEVVEGGLSARSFLEEIVIEESESLDDTSREGVFEELQFSEQPFVL